MALEHVKITPTIALAHYDQYSSYQTYKNLKISYWMSQDRYEPKPASNDTNSAMATT